MLNSGYISFQIWLHLRGGIVIAELYLSQFLKKSKILDMERATQMCDDYILLGNTKPKQRGQQIGWVFL